MGHLGVLHDAARSTGGEGRHMGGQVGLSATEPGRLLKGGSKPPRSRSGPVVGWRFQLPPCPAHATRPPDLAHSTFG
ncbi:hypothetical protein [Ornithinimicrobium kibberense]|uniref:hypothetical protein n=1 Tax=Ornithinimicrobium kibberense TaxID=282060 RepID=UPI0036071521